MNPLLFDWAITSKCNLHCLHCRGMSQDELSKEDVIKVAYEVVELKPRWVIIEGGEPLMSPALWDVFEVLTSNKIPISLITNGTLLTSENIEKLGKLKIDVQLSIDSPVPEVYENIRREASFKQVKQNAETLAKTYKISAINFVLSKNNYKDIPQMFEFAKELGAGLINILGVKPIKVRTPSGELKLDMENYKTQMLSPEEYKIAITSACSAGTQYKIDFFFDEPFFHNACRKWGISNLQSPIPNSQLQGKIVVPEISGCVFGKYLFMEPNGDLKPCTFADFTIGNAKNGIRKVWDDFQKSELLTKIRKQENRKGKCKKCDYFNECGGCRSRMYALTSDWFASDSACPIRIS